MKEPRIVAISKSIIGVLTVTTLLLGVAAFPGHIATIIGWTSPLGTPLEVIRFIAIALIALVVGAFLPPWRKWLGLMKGEPVLKFEFSRETHFHDQPYGTSGSITIANHGDEIAENVKVKIKSLILASGTDKASPSPHMYRFTNAPLGGVREGIMFSLVAGEKETIRVYGTGKGEIKRESINIATFDEQKEPWMLSAPMADLILTVLATASNAAPCEAVFEIKVMPGGGAEISRIS